RQLPGFHSRPVDLRLVRGTPVDLDLDEQLAFTVLQSGPDDRGLLILPDHGPIARDPVRAERAQEAERLDEVRLALAVAAHEEIRTLFKGDLCARIVPEVGEAEVRDKQR